MWIGCGPTAAPTEVLTLAGRRRGSVVDLLYRAREGPRVPGAGQLAEDLRLLRAQLTATA
jgi:hypothetical protein